MTTSSTAALFRELELPTPWIPTELESKLSQLDEWVFGTSDPENGVYDIETYIQMATDPDGEDFLFIGHAGHGTQNYFLHYYLRVGSLRVLLQTPFGGIYDDPAECQEVITQHFEGIERLASAAIDEPIVVVQSSIIMSRWATLSGSEDSVDTINWKMDIDALKTVADSYSAGPNSMISV